MRFPTSRSAAQGWGSRYNLLLCTALSAYAFGSCRAARVQSGSLQSGFPQRKSDFPATWIAPRKLLASLACNLTTLESCGAAFPACCACDDSVCTKPDRCISRGPNSNRCPAGFSKPACCRQTTGSNTLRERDMYTAISPLAFSLSPALAPSGTIPAPSTRQQLPSMAPRPESPSAPVYKVHNCTVHENVVYSEASSISMGSLVNTTVDSCAAACQLATGCNVFQWCPLGSENASCYAGAGSYLSALSCKLLQEAGVDGDFPMTQQLGPTDMTTGMCLPEVAPVSGSPLSPAGEAPIAGDSRAQSAAPPLVLIGDPAAAPPASSAFPMAAVAGAGAGIIAVAGLLALAAGWCFLQIRLDGRMQAGRKEILENGSPKLTNPFITSGSQSGFSETINADSGSQPSAQPLADERPSLIRVSSSSVADSTSADFVAIQQQYGCKAANLPAPWLKGVTQYGVASILLHTEVPEHLELEEEELRDTWKIDPKDLTCRMRDGQPIVLGEGGFGRVYRGHLHREEVAVKVITSHTPKQQRSFLKEIHTLRACYNPHIVQFLGACVREKQTFMVMEFMPRGDLRKRLDEGGTQEFGWYSKGRQVALETLQGLIYLHSRDIAHLDLKSHNILLTAHDHAKIGDVGLGKMVRSPKSGPPETGSFLWAAPEQLMGGEVGTASDIFPFGTVLWEICTAEKLKQRYLRDVDVPGEAPAAVADVIRRCRTADPSKRPTAEEIYDELLKAT